MNFLTERDLRDQEAWNRSVLQNEMAVDQASFSSAPNPYSTKISGKVEAIAWLLNILARRNDKGKKAQEDYVHQAT